jgi:hypothetical protein
MRAQALGVKSQGLPLNTIVLGAIAILVLVVIAVAVIPAMGGIFSATSAGDVTDVDTCEHNCRMMQLFAQYAYQAGPNSQYCQSGCIGIADCVIRKEVVSAANCLGQCDSNGDCPPTSGTCCTGNCVNTNTDNSNCGTCGNPCTLSQTCTGGICG